MVANMLGASQHNFAATGNSMVLNRTRKAFNSRTVTLEPGATKQVALGSYFISDPKPEFEVKTAPTDLLEHIGSSLEIINIPGSQKYVAFYHLQNFSDKPCDVTIVKRA